MKEEKEKCLVTEARSKCKCEWCKQVREFEKMLIKQQIALEVHKIMFNILKEGAKD